MHVRKDRNGVMPRDRRLDVAKAFQEHCAFDRRFHSDSLSLSCGPVRWREVPERQGAADDSASDSLPPKMSTFLNERTARCKPCLQCTANRANAGGDAARAFPGFDPAGPSGRDRKSVV